ncbi:MAG TPA: complement resistance protein TraT, partial [Arsenophonus nasoniae]
MAHPFKRLILVGFISTSLALTGCSAVSTAVKKRNLEVKTQMS